MGEGNVPRVDLSPEIGAGNVPSPDLPLEDPARGSCSGSATASTARQVQLARLDVADIEVDS